MRGVLDTTLCDKDCQWPAADRWFTPGTPRSLDLDALNDDDVKNILKSLQIGQASDGDSISHQMLKHTRHCVLTLEIYFQSFE